MPKENLLGIFYRGVLNEVRRTLDTASYGNFASLDCEQAELLIENLAESEACYGGDYDRTLRGGSSGDDAKFEKLSERFDKLSRALMVNNQGSYQEYGSSEDVVERQEMVNYVGNQGGYNYNQASNSNTQNQPQGFHQPRPNLAPNYQQGYKSRGNNFQQQRATSNQVSQDLDFKTMFQSIMEGQVRGQQETERKFKEMQAQIDQVTSNVNSLNSQVSQLTSPSQDLEIKTMFNLIMEGQAKGQQEMVAINEKLVEVQAQINRITSRLDCLEGQMTQVTAHVKTLDSQVAQLASSSQRTTGTLPASYAMEPPSAYCGTITNGEALIELKEATKKASSQGVKAKTKEEVKVVKVGKGAKKKKLEKAQSQVHESHPPSITLKPLKIIDGKLECKVNCKGHSKPFTKARIILDPDSKTKGDLSMVTSKMATLFGLKLDDRGPLQDGPPPTKV